MRKRQVIQTPQMVAGYPSKRVAGDSQTSFASNATNRAKRDLHGKSEQDVISPSKVHFDRGTPLVNQKQHSIHTTDGGIAKETSSHGGPFPTTGGATSFHSGSPDSDGPAATLPHVGQARKNCTLTAGERVQLQLCAQVTIDCLVKSNESALSKCKELASHQNPKIIKKISNYVISGLLLEKEILFPTEEVQQSALLEELGICKNKEQKAYEEFMRAWSNHDIQPNFRTIMKDAMRKRKGSLTKALRDELYAQLNVRKYHRGATLQERDSFIKKLESHKVDDAWGTSEREDGDWDPWGSVAVHAAISKALYGVHYIPEQNISLSLEFAAFIFYVLMLAMDDRNLQGNERLTLAGELEAMKQRIIEWFPYMTSITVKFPDI